MRALIRRLSVGAGASCLAAGLVGVPLAHAAPAPAPQTGAAQQHVIVLLKNQHPEAPAGRSTIGRRHQLVAADQARLVSQARGSGGRDFRQLSVANAFAATLPASEVARLAGDPAVAEIVPDRVVRAPAHASGTPTPGAARGPVSGATCPSDPAHPQLEPEALQLTHTNSGDPRVPSAQGIATGRGVTVAFLADGVDVDNPDFIRPDGSHVFTDYQDFSGDGPTTPTSSTSPSAATGSPTPTTTRSRSSTSSWSRPA